jgi:DNA-binding beta-propeller fold protein YncE
MARVRVVYDFQEDNPTISRMLKYTAGAAMLVAIACARTAPSSTPSPVTTVAAGTASTAAAPDRDYLLYVASEATDRIALIRFGPAGAKIERETTTGSMPADVDGPHGVAVAPDGKHWYTTTAHGTPYGFLWKYATGTDELIGRVMLGNFPATAQLTPDGALAFVVNFNLHGEMVPSSVSIVATDEMVEIARVQTCTMPHGSRINRQGTRQYSACMMDDMAIEIDTRTLGLSRHFMLRKGAEHGMSGPPGQHRPAAGASHDAGGHGMSEPKPGDVSCSPTWAQPSADGGTLFVACNKSSEIVEIDVASWTLGRRIPAGPGVYNLAVTSDGKLLIGTNKRGQSVSIFEIASGREIARLATKRRVTHGAVVSPDDRYVFVSVEGVGSEPGTVEVIDLRALKTVATVDVGQMAGGIDFWRMEPTR